MKSIVWSRYLKTILKTLKNEKRKKSKIYFQINVFHEMQKNSNISKIFKFLIKLYKRGTHSTHKAILAIISK